MSVHVSFDLSITGSTNNLANATAVRLGALVNGLHLRHDSTGGVPLRVKFGTTGGTTGDMEIKVGEAHLFDNLITGIDKLSVLHTSTSTAPTLLRVNAWG